MYAQGVRERSAGGLRWRTRVDSPVPIESTAVPTEPPDCSPMLSRCVATDTHTFATTYWGRAPLLSSADALPRDFSDLLSPDEQALFILPDLSEEIDGIRKDESLDEEERKEREEVAYRDHSQRTEAVHNINQLMKAYSLFEKDVQYIKSRHLLKGRYQLKKRRQVLCLYIVTLVVQRKRL